MDNLKEQNNGVVYKTLEEAIEDIKLYLTEVYKIKIDEVVMEDSESFTQSIHSCFGGQIKLSKMRYILFQSEETELYARSIEFKVCPFCGTLIIRKSS